MKFNIFYTLKSAGGTIEAPNKPNPIECANLASVLVNLAHNLINNDMIQTVGVRVVEIQNDVK